MAAARRRPPVLASASPPEGDKYGHMRRGMTTMLRNTTVSELVSLQERCAELKRTSMRPETIEETESAVAVALRQKTTQYELELDRIRRTVLKGTVARAMQRNVGDRVALEEAMLANGAPSYRERTRTKRARTRTDFEALIAGGRLGKNMEDKLRQNIEKLKELDELEVFSSAHSHVDELAEMHCLTPEEEQEVADRANAAIVGQAERAELLETEFDRLDPDKTGFIEPQALLAALHAEEQRRGIDPMEAMTMREVILVINRLDGVGGQKDGVLELREFVAGMKNVTNVTTSTVMSRFFELRDEVEIDTQNAMLADKLRRDQSFKLHHDPFRATSTSQSAEVSKLNSWNMHRTKRL